MSNKSKFFLSIIFVLVWAGIFVELAELYNLAALRFAALLPTIFIFGFSAFTNFPPFINKYLQEVAEQGFLESSWSRALLIGLLLIAISII